MVFEKREKERNAYEEERKRASEKKKKREGVRYISAAPPPYL